MAAVRSVKKGFHAESLDRIGVVLFAAGCWLLWVWWCRCCPLRRSCCWRPDVLPAPRPGCTAGCSIAPCLDLPCITGSSIAVCPAASSGWHWVRCCWLAVLRCCWCSPGAGCRHWRCWDWRPGAQRCWRCAPVLLRRTPVQRSSIVRADRTMRCSSFSSIDSSASSALRTAGASASAARVR